jgi:23S rRNA (cytosine1962-C5)-methyltransferase
MDPRRVWPDFDEKWIRYEDDDVIVVDKPVGVPSQPADPERPDDLVTRLRAHLEARDGHRAYLGIHQRLDKDTSGVLLMTRRREANAAIAAQFEGRKVTKRYLACVTGWPRKAARTTLRNALALEGGRMRVTSPGDRRGDLAITHVERLADREDRALLGLTLETGRTHQARVQLAHAGAPIAGDRLYGGGGAPRLMLHASSIELVHPQTRAVLRVDADAPPEFDDWLKHGDMGVRIYDEPAALDRAIARAVQARFALGRAIETGHVTTAFRLGNEAGDGLPSLAVDLYDGYLVAQFYGDARDELPRGGGPTTARGARRSARAGDDTWRDPARRERVLDRLFALGARGVYLKQRTKQANVPNVRREELSPRSPVRGEAAPDEFEILEDGLAYTVRLADGPSTGIFLDQRHNRRRVRDFADGKSVLNLFAYTCPFSMAAAAGGAPRTTSVDVAMPALERGRANMQRAGLLHRGDHRFIADDVFAWMPRAQRAKESFDLVIVDPPSFATTKRTTFAVASDYAELAAQAMALVLAKGALLACINHRGVTRARFRRFLHDAARIAQRKVAQLKDLPDPSDFPAPLGGECHLKSAWVTFAD